MTKMSKSNKAAISAAIMLVVFSSPISASAQTESADIHVYLSVPASAIDRIAEETPPKTADESNSLFWGVTAIASACEIHVLKRRNGVGENV